MVSEMDRSSSSGSSSSGSSSSSVASTIGSLPKVGGISNDDSTALGGGLVSATAASTTSTSISSYPLIQIPRIETDYINNWHRVWSNRKSANTPGSSVLETLISYGSSVLIISFYPQPVCK